MTDLVRRYIQLRSGRRAWRFVKPDNPNIVQPQPGAEELDVPVPPKVEAPVRQTKTVLLVKDYNGCCGAAVVEPEERFVDETDLEMKTRRWAGLYKVHYYDHYMRMSETTLDSYYKKHYAKLVEQYGLEHMLKGNQLNREPYFEFNDKYKSYGITISTVEFSRSAKTPAGLFVRNDYPARASEDAEYDLTDAILETPEPFGEDKLSRQRVSGWNLDNCFSTKQHGNMHVICGMGSDDLANMLSTYIADRKEIEPGHVVSFVLNRGQQTQRKANTLAAAGFRCTLVTANQNHRRSSILYLYERVVTEDDKKL